RARLGRLRQQAQVSRFVMRDERRRPEEGDADMAGDQVVDRLAGAAIGNVVELDVRHLREPFSSTCWFDPAPEVAQPSPGGCFAVAINSATELTPSVGCAASASGWRASCMTGTSSFK